MARPNNSIATIKLPGDTTARPIVPYALGYSSSNGFQAKLPELTADAVLALASDLTNYVTLTTAQTISGTKTFTNNIIVDSSKKITFNDASNPASIGYAAGGYITTTNLRAGSYVLPGNGNGTGSIGISSIRWGNYYGVNENLSGKLTLTGSVSDGNNANYGLVLPNTTSYTANRTIATLNDIPVIDIVDLTQL